MIKGVATSIITVGVLMGSLVACGGTTQVVAPTPEPTVEETPEEGHDEEGHDEGDAERQFLINTLLDLGPGDPPEVVECVVDLIVDLSGLGYIEIEQMFLGLIASELDPYLESERFRQECDAVGYSYS